MKNIVLTYGLISGGIVAVLMAISIPLFLDGTLDPASSQILGFSSMILAFLAVFFGIRTYREHSGGAITFGRAFKVGILITLIACAVYVIGWEIVYWNFIPDFADKYAVIVLDRMRAEGASAQEIAEKSAKMEQFKKLYRNPLFNVGMTFLEIFPVGLIVTLVSAAILRRKSASEAAPAGA